MNRHKNTNQDKVLSKEQIEETKKNSIRDGCAYNVMYGFGEQYITPYALKLGATNAEIGILGSVPSFIGSLFQLLGAKLIDKFQSRKKIVMFAVLMQAVMLLPLFIIPLLTKNILLLTLIFTIYLTFANMAAPGWNSWIGAVIPDNERAEYFSKRNKITITFLLLSVSIAGIILNYFTIINIWLGFGILFVIAFFGRLTSWYFFFRQHEPKYITQRTEYFSFKDFLKRMPETNFGNFVIFRSLMALAVMIASPFFAVYMLKDLNFTYFQYMIIVLVPMLIKILTMTYWGKYSKEFGTRNIMIISAFLIAIIPVAWFLAGFFFFGHPIIFFFVMLAEMISGFAWAGFELTTFTYVLETVSPEKRARAVAYFNIVFGTAVLIGGLFGSWLVINLPREYKGVSLLLIVFVISAIARFIVPILFLSKLKEVKVDKEISEKKLFMDLVISKPLHSAMHQTTNIIFLAEKNIAKVTKDAGKGIDLIKKSKRRDYKYLTNENYHKYLKLPHKVIKKLDRKKTLEINIKNRKKDNK